MAKKRTVASKNSVPYILTLIAGIWAVIRALIYLVTKKISTAGVAEQFASIFSRLVVAFSILLLILGILMLWGSMLIKNNKRSGATLTLVVSILFLLTISPVPGILGLIGAILAFKK